MLTEKKMATGMCYLFIHIYIYDIYIYVFCALRVLSVCKQNKSWEDKVNSNYIWVVGL